MAVSEKDVSTPTAIHNKLKDNIRLARTLMGGTRAMRAAKELYLPKEVAETFEAYEARLKRSTLFNAFRKTVRDMSGKVFQRPIVLGSDVPANIKDWCENIDLAGRHINVFAYNLFFDALQTGITYIMADMPPPLQRPDGKPATLADEQQAGNRPYLVHVPIERLIGWKSELINGAEVLTEARVAECAYAPDGEYDQKEVPQIRVLRPGSWELWQQSQEGVVKEWQLIDSGTTSLNFIPLTPVYLNRTEFMQGEPPLEDLADLNVRHWQSQSDQTNILHVARVPILFGAGFNAEDRIAIGASTMVRTSDPDAKLSYVEHSGAAIASGDADLKNLEAQMQTQGLQLLVPNPGQTATGEVRDEAKENTPLAMMARALQDGLETALDFLAQFAGMGADAGGSVTVNTDFGKGINTPTELQVLSSMVTAGQLSKETLWQIMVDLDYMPDDFDPDVEKDRLDSEAPDLTAKTPMDLSGGADDGQGDNANG